MLPCCVSSLRTFWLSSIHVHAPDALVFIVGSHADVVAGHEETEARVEEEIVWKPKGGGAMSICQMMDGSCCFYFEEYLSRLSLA
eukprot:s5761_g1.t1